MKKRYQVFVSSTYEDLKEERFEVLKALLELDCIPCGMEYFPAASEDQWSYIRELIAECDYYIVIVAGRYGSTDEGGVSYTEKEYDYAVEQGIPTIGFIHRDPNGRPARFTEATEEGRRKLADFSLKVQRKLCKQWSTPDELGAVVGRSISHLIKRTPRRGWVRADAVETPEIETLKAKVAWLLTAVDRLRSLSDIPSLTSSPQPGKGPAPATDVAGGELSEDDLDFLAELDRAIHGGFITPAKPQPVGTDRSVVAVSSNVDRTNTNLEFLEELDRAIAGGKPRMASVSAPPPSADYIAKRPAETLVCKECGALNEPSAWYCEICGVEL
jgi:ribosomal protein L40E